MSPRKRRLLALLTLTAGGALCLLVLRVLVSHSASDPQQSAPAPYVSSGKFTTAHASPMAAVKEYLDSYPTKVHQPITFTHKVHLKNGMPCTACHKGVTTGPNASLPSVTLCMTCHRVIATKKPEIKKLAAYYKKGEEVPWRRVYWFYPSAHVRFWHRPHIRAGVRCKTCHGDMRRETVAVRKAGLTMGFCVDCHKAHHASTDCTTCHN